MKQTNSENFALLDQTIPNQADYGLAVYHAPRIRFDVKEPFFPSVMGYTIFRESGTSLSFPREINLAENVATVIEYAIWWDWDIQHLYELEHIWIHLDANGHIINAEASWHGGQNQMLNENGDVPLENGRLVLYSEPGKHAFAPSIQWLLERKPITDSGCGKRAGVDGVLVTGLFKDVIHDATPNNNQVVMSFLIQRAFEPTYEFSQIFELEKAIFVPWNSLNDWIPKRVHWWTQELERTIPPHQRRVLRIAHRGASAHAQENSAQSFQKAAELGSDMVEVDVRITKDQIPVVAHDQSLRRVHGIDKNIIDLTLDELKWQTPILTLEETVKICRELHIGLYLDIKEINSQATVSLFEAVEKHGMTRYTIFSSFRPDYVAEIKAHHPDIHTSILFGSTHIDPVSLASAVKADYVHPCWEHQSDEPNKLLTSEWMQRVRKAGLGVICWHEERPTVIAGLKALGVNGICSDEPERLLD